MLSEIYQTDTVHHLHMVFTKAKFIQRVGRWLPGPWGRGKWGDVEYRLTVRWIGPENLMHIIVIVVNNDVLYTESRSYMFLPQKKEIVIMWCDGRVS